jgi:uncharacterized protein (TIGR02145 family)
MKKTSFILFLCLFHVIGYPRMDVKSFRILENDMDARVNAPIKDFNGELSAIVKVVTVQSGFSFDCGQLGVVKTVYKPSEIWVYLPHGAKRLTIMHPQLGQLRDYIFPIPIEAGTVYEMVLISGIVEHIVKEDPSMSDLEKYGREINILSTPTNQPLYIDGNLVGNTPHSTKLLSGNHTLAIDNGIKKQEMPILLAPFNIRLKSFHLYYPEEVKDIDGNVYSTLQIGTQKWMLENLRTTHYRNGDLIPFVNQEKEWHNTKEGAICLYDNDPDNKEKYGLLYNWYSLQDVRRIAPEGWHVANKEDFELLTKYLISHGYNYDGSLGDNMIAKSLASKVEWKDSYIKLNTPGDDIKSNNRSGFNGIPTGYRGSDSNYERILETACWWSNPINDTGGEAFVYMIDKNEESPNFYPVSRNSGFAIRCVKNE